MRQTILYITILIFTLSCESHTTVELAPGWNHETVLQWQDEKPDMIVISKNGKFLYISCETTTDMLSPSLVRFDLQSRVGDAILYGLNRADGLKMDQHGDLWLGEEVPDGLIFKINSPEMLPAEQRFDRQRLVGSDPNTVPILAAGRFSHEGMAFSRDHRYLYLADEWKEGSLYRYEIASRKLMVFHSVKGWLEINTPTDSRFKAEVLHAKYFNRLEDMEQLPDGTILMAETGSKNSPGRIWKLDDRGPQPTVSHFLEHPELQHPDNLEWDAKREWLWITDDSSPSKLLAWDGKTMTQVAQHSYGEITGVESSSDGTIYFNVQGNPFGPDMTIKMFSDNEAK